MYILYVSITCARARDVVDIIPKFREASGEAASTHIFEEVRGRLAFEKQKKKKCNKYATSRDAAKQRSNRKISMDHHS